MKNSIKKTVLALIILVTTFSSCTNEERCISGNGNIVTESFELDNFSKVYSYINAKVIISQGETQSISVTGDSNIINLLKKQVINNRWEIINKNNDVECINNYSLEINIVVKDLNAVGSAGSGTILVNDFFNQESIDIETVGSSNIELSSFKDTKKITATTIGTGNITFNGTNFSSVTSITSKIDGSGDVSFGNSVDFSSLKNAKITINGSGDYKAFSVKSDNYVVSSNGSGSCEVYAINNLNVAINGSGSVYYKGKPNLNKAINGSGSLIDGN